MNLHPIMSHLYPPNTQGLKAEALIFFFIWVFLDQKRLVLLYCYRWTNPMKLHVAVTMEQQQT